MASQNQLDQFSRGRARGAGELLAAPTGDRYLGGLCRPGETQAGQSIRGWSKPVGLWEKISSPTMDISFFIAQLDGELSAGSSPGWAVIRHEPGQQNRYASRIFLREQDAVAHAHRLTMQEVSRARKAAASA